MKKFFSFFAALLFAGSMMAETVELAAGTFNGKEGVYTEGWSTTGTGATRTDCVVVGAGENITSPTIDLSEFESVIVSIKARRFGSLSGSKAVIAVAFGELEVGTVEATGTSATTSLEDIEYTLPAGLGEGAFVFTCTNATSAGSTHGAGINSIVISGVKGGPEPTMNYYVCGNMTSWGPNAEYMLAPANDGLYRGEFTFAADDEFKVVYSDGASIADENWFPTGMGNNYKITENGDYAITFNPNGGVEGWYEGYFEVAKKEEPVIDTLTCAEAAEAAAAGSTAEVYVKGYVTSIQNAWKDGVMTFWMADTKDGGKVFEAYKCAIEKEEDAVRVGDLVKAHGNLAKYNTTYELAAGCTVEILERAEEPKNLGPKTIAEFLELKNSKDTCILTGVVSNIVNTTYGNFDLTDETGMVYVYGLLTPEGESKKFAELGVAEGDTLTIKAVYGEYQGNPQAPNAVFVEVKKKAIEPGEIIEIQWVSTSATVKYVDNCESDGWWQVQAQNADYYITLSNAGSIASAPGTYTVADLDADYSYIEELATEKVIAFVEGSVTLSVDEEGNVFFEGEFLGDDNNTYVITIIYAAGTDTKHQYDDDSDFIVDFESYEVDETYLAQYHSVNVLALDEAGNYINLDVTLADEAEAFEAGVYPIDEEYLPQTVHAGFFDEGYLIASFAAIRTDAVISRVWYLVSGTVTVDEDLNVAVDAVNSLGHAIKVNLKSGKHQGVEAVKAENGVVKSLKNGMLLIEKNGVQFNTVGQIVR